MSLRLTILKGRSRQRQQQRRLPEKIKGESGPDGDDDDEEDAKDDGVS